MLRYVGKAFLPGVPARDLSDAEAELFGQSFLLSTGLYVLVEDEAEDEEFSEEEE